MSNQSRTESQFWPGIVGSRLRNRYSGMEWSTVSCGFAWLARSFSIGPCALSIGVEQMEPTMVLLLLLMLQVLFPFPDRVVESTHPSAGACTATARPRTGLSNPMNDGRHSIMASAFFSGPRRATPGALCAPPPLLRFCMRCTVPSHCYVWTFCARATSRMHQGVEPVCS